MIKRNIQNWIWSWTYVFRRFHSTEHKTFSRKLTLFMVNCDCHQVKNTFEAKDLLNTFIQRTTMSRSSITFKPLTNWIRLDKTVSQTMPDAFVFYSRNYTQSIPHWVEQFCLEILKWESLIFILLLITISTLQT